MSIRRNKTISIKAPLWFIWLLCCCSFAAVNVQAEDASLSGTVISIPVVLVGDAFYRVELTLIAGADPVAFNLTGGELITGASSDGASALAGATLTIPAIQVGELNYRIELDLINQSPITFQLSGISVNAASVDPDATALELFTSNLAIPVVQNRCIACHVEGGIGRATGLVFQRENTASTLNNFNVFDSFLDTRDDGLNYILSKASGNDHTGGIQLARGGADYNNLQDFLATLGDSIESSTGPSPGEDFFAAVTLL
jgi:hypothetical protein